MKNLVSINPFTLEEIARIDETSDTDLQRLLMISGEVFQKYKNLSFQTRKERMLKAAEILESKSSKFASIITAEMGKLLREAEAEVKKCAWVCRYYAENAEAFLANDLRESDASESYVRYQPIGPVLAVMPWNFPFWQVFRFAAPNLMIGNTALLKHASNVQGCAKAIESIFLEAGFEPGVFKNLPISSSKVEQVIASSEVKAVTLTGSEEAGSAVAAVAGKYIKKCVLELGGNNAFVVLNDADIDLALDSAIQARLQNSGQSCIAAKRFILEADIHDAFVSKLIFRLSRLVEGDPTKAVTDLAPLFSVAQAKEVDSQVKRSVADGAILKYGGQLNKAFFSPAVLLKVIPGMPVFEEETFGPVFAVSKAKNLQHALELSNASIFGLGMQVFTQSEEKSKRFISEANEGAVFVNGMVKSDPRLPFGGVKRSGFGRELAREGILEFMNVKTVWVK